MGEKIGLIPFKGCLREVLEVLKKEKGITVFAHHEKEPSVKKNQQKRRI